MRINIFLNFFVKSGFAESFEFAPLYLKNFCHAGTSFMWDKIFRDMKTGTCRVLLPYKVIISRRIINFKIKF